MNRLKKKFKKTSKLVVVNRPGHETNGKFGMIIFETSANAKIYESSGHMKHLPKNMVPMYYVVTWSPLRILGPLWEHELTFV